FEWVQNLQSFYWDEEETNSRLTQLMQRAFRDVWQLAQEKKVNLRLAAQMLALHRVAEAIQLRGIFP
ncbi:hypothetical protein H5T52_12465, partial [Candidatus Bipolaricaulota bacterium]|nr:hypothetical protein [Candidatus Bipolaricaulota bacterium]